MSTLRPSMKIESAGSIIESDAKMFRALEAKFYEERGSLGVCAILLRADVPAHASKHGYEQKKLLFRGHQILGSMAVVSTFGLR